jgi:transposase
MGMPFNTDGSLRHGWDSCRNNTPRGGKTILGRITKHGNVYLRTLLIHGARAVLQFSAKRTDRKSRWVEAVRQRRGSNIAAVALAAKHARILWVLLAHRQEYQFVA